MSQVYSLMWDNPCVHDLSLIVKTIAGPGMVPIKIQQDCYSQRHTAVFPEWTLVLSSRGFDQRRRHWAKGRLAESGLFIDLYSLFSLL